MSATVNKGFHQLFILLISPKSVGNESLEGNLVGAR